MKKIVSELSATVDARILMKGAIKDLSIAVAYMLDDFDGIKQNRNINIVQMFIFTTTLHE